jgi:Rrf2 family transcriptional regulator, iron-sulfur cluster assembly transcription factor
MQLSMTGEYAIQAMIFLAELPIGKTIQISEISKKRNIPESLLRKIVSQLRKLGLIFSTRGKSGGITLSRSADLITLLDIIESTEGKIYLNKCLIGSEFCNRINMCAVHSVWKTVQNQMTNTLSEATLASLVSKEKQLKKYKIGG